MARVRPFAAWRYNRIGDISPLTAPPYDVISPEERADFLAEEAHNVVALELPDGSTDPAAENNRYETGARIWNEWRETGVLKRDSEPCVYVLEQRYRLGERDVSRKAFIVAVGLEPFDAGVILPHERTLPKALGDRFELTKSTGANLSQVFSLFADDTCESDDLFDEIMALEPVATATDADGVDSMLWATSDPDVAARLAAFMEPRPLFIADGHHRYTTALAYRDLRREQLGGAAEAEVDAENTAGASTDARDDAVTDTDADSSAHAAATPADEPAYDYVLMALVNMDDPDLVVLPTHRVADAAGDFDAAHFKAQLAEKFTIDAVDPQNQHGSLDDIEEPAFLVKMRGDNTVYRARLREDIDLDDAMPANTSDAWRGLDVAVLQELVLNPLLDIHPDRAESLDRLTFVKGAHAAMEAAMQHDVALILRATRMDQLREVALGHETMPQKSTYFYPKVLSGMLFRSAE